MELFEQIADIEFDPANPDLIWEKHRQISDKIKSYDEEIRAGFQPGSGTARAVELQAKVWELLHASFFLTMFSQPNPKHALEQALSQFELKLVDVNNMDDLGKQSFNEFKRIVEIARRLVGLTSSNED